MVRVLEQFSGSFYLALILWPVTALLLTIPVLVWQYRRNYELTRSYVAFAYVSVLYGLGLVACTLYPLPDDPASYCLSHSVGQQLVPLSAMC